MAENIPDPAQTSQIIPFGKYKGRQVEELIADPNYRDWLAAQPWFRERFPAVYQVIINYGGEPIETPEHNALQARFLEPAFCIAVASMFKNWRSYIGNNIPETSTVFEYYGWDVFTTFSRPWAPSIAVECKPTLGDDYPKVLRQVNSYREPAEYHLLLLENYTGRAVPLASVRRIFAASNIHLIMVSEVEALL